ncbi:MAG: KH domain-containing protein [Verrucomicrobia bacterium]|nr:KH domain-containing protein [Verrucomicrobiota bacterium]
MQEWLEYVVKGLVSRPEEVKVVPVDRGGQILYQLSVAPEDVGRVIGKKGATIHALRALLQVGCARKGVRATVDILEEKPAEGQAPPDTPQEGGSQ